MTRSTSGHYSRTAAQSPAGGHHTLAETESAVSERLANLELDMGSMAAVRNHLERTVLAPHELTWTGWVVLWVVWIWGDIETRHAATEAGISKGTLTGVVGTLEGRGFLTRRTHPDDARRVLLALTTKGKRLMSQVFPEFNREEARLMSALSTDEVATLTQGLRKAVASLDD